MDQIGYVEERYPTSKRMHLICREFDNNVRAAELFVVNVDYDFHNEFAVCVVWRLL